MAASSLPLRTSAPPGAEAITHPGKLVLWIGFACLSVPALAMLFAISQQPDGKRRFHILCFLANLIGSLAYLTMATGHGSIFVDGEGGYREFFYARYVEWALTTPLILLNVLGLASASTDTVLWLLCTTVVMIVSGLIASLIGCTDDWCWTFWAFGLFAYAPIVYFLTCALPSPGCPEATKTLARRVARATVILWTIYHVLWVIAESRRTISLNVAVLFYAIVDVLTKTGISLLIIGSREGVNQALKPTRGTGTMGLLGEPHSPRTDYRSMHSSQSVHSDADLVPENRS